MIIDIDKLRNYLIDYYGSAAFSGMPMAIFDLERVRHASPEELVEIAQKENINLALFQ